MITVQVNDEYIVEALLKRLSVWTDDETVRELYEKMYKNYADGGCFDNVNIGDFNSWVMGIVDNDWVNYTDIIHKGEEDFDQLLEAYKNGDRDVSCKRLKCGASFAEALSDDEEAILVRY